MRKVNIKMSIIPKLTHTFNTIQVSTGIFFGIKQSYLWGKLTTLSKIGKKILKMKSNMGI